MGYKHEGNIGLSPKRLADKTSILPFLNQAQANGYDDSFSVFYALDTNLQSKIIFGPPEAQKYGKSGSTNDDIQWAKVPSTIDDNLEKWIVDVKHVDFGKHYISNSIHDNGQSIHALIDTGTTYMSIDTLTY